jgi:hypothetical protein
MKKTPFWRIPLILVVGVIAAGGAAYWGGLIPSYGYPPENAIMVIQPYKYAGTWVFDDPAVGLQREPFVAGVPEMIDELVEDIPDAEEGFRLTFSTRPFPSHTHTLTWRRAEEGGNWYYCEELEKEGWLCPGLFKYYREAPEQFYVRADAVS